MQKEYYCQALINGIIITGNKKQTTTIVKDDGKVIIKKQKMKFASNDILILNTPLIRGMVILINYLISFLKSLNDSAETIRDELEKRDNNKKISVNLNLYLIDVLIFIAIIFSITICFISLIILPSIIVYLLDMIIKINLLDTILESLLRIFIFYIILKFSGKLKKLKNMYMYHGAFHKTLKCYNNKEELTLNNIKKYSCYDVSCGLTLIFDTMIISTLVFAIIQIVEPNLLNTFNRILYTFMISGILYEIICLLSNKKKNYFMFGRLFQKTLVQEPDDEIILLVKKAFETNLSNNNKGDAS